MKAVGRDLREVVGGVAQQVLGTGALIKLREKPDGSSGSRPASSEAGLRDRGAGGGLFRAVGTFDGHGDWFAKFVRCGRECSRSGRGRRERDALS